VTAAVSPRSLPQSSTGRFDVRMVECVFRVKRATDSGPWRPPIPAEESHPFQGGQPGVISG